MLVVFLGLITRFRKNASVLLEQEKADGNLIRAAYAQIEREQTAMANIQAAMGSGHWSMEFNEKAEMTACTWTDVWHAAPPPKRPEDPSSAALTVPPSFSRRQYVFRNMLGYGEEEEFPNRLESWTNLLHEEDKENVIVKEGGLSPVGMLRRRQSVLKIHLLPL